jgi:hypothetical protein
MDMFSLNEIGEALPLDAIADCWVIDEKEQGTRQGTRDYYGAGGEGWVYLSRMLRTQFYSLSDKLGGGGSTKKSLDAPKYSKN